MDIRRARATAHALEPGDRVTLGGAAGLIVWAAVPVWYRSTVGPTTMFGRTVGGDRLGGFHGLGLVAVVLAACAIAWVLVRAAGGRLERGLRPGTADEIAGAFGLVLTLLSVVVRPPGFDPAWGVFVALLPAAAWAAGGFIRYERSTAGGTAAAADGAVR